jgi:crotonobetainyl-CoA:carnitine CoA-transferase CaiB-like acyl-CoA transferase
MRHRQMLVDLDLPGAGPVPVLNTPFNFSGGKSAPQGPPPRLGEHTREVLHALLDLSDAEIDNLTGQGVLGSPSAARRNRDDES